MADKVVDRIDTEEFIIEVEKYPSIWNVQADEYTDRIAKRIAWNNVLNHFIKDFEEKTSSEKQEFCILLQKKWKNLRDCYTRELNKQKQDSKLGSAAKPRKTYVFYDLLKFLDVAIKQNSNSLETDEDESKNGEESGNEEPTEPVTVKPKGGRKRKVDNEDELFLKCLKTEYLERKKQDANDEDRLFMLSLVPELKKVPDHMKLGLKSRIMTMIGHAKETPHPRNQRSNYQPYNNGENIYPDFRSTPQLDNFGLGQCTPVQVTVPVTVSPMFPVQSPQNGKIYPVQPLFSQPPDRNDSPSPSEVDHS